MLQHTAPHPAANFGDCADEGVAEEEEEEEDEEQAADENSQLMMQLSNDNFNFCDVSEEPRFVFDESLMLPVQLSLVSDLSPIVKSPIISMAVKEDSLALTDGYFVYVFELSARQTALQCKRSFRIAPRGVSDFCISCVKLRNRDLLYAAGNLCNERTAAAAGCLTMTNLMGEVLSYKAYADGQVSGFDFDQSGGIFLCYSGSRKAISRIIKLSSDLRHQFHLDIDWDKVPKQISCCWDSNETWVSGLWGSNGGFLLSMKSHDPKGIAEVNNWLKPSAWRFERLLPNQLLSLSEGRLLTVNSANREGSLYVLYWTRRVPGVASQGWVPECQRVHHKDNEGVTALCSDRERSSVAYLVKGGLLYQLQVTAASPQSGAATSCSIS